VSLHRPGSGPPPWQEQVRGGYSDRHAAGLSGSAVACSIITQLPPAVGLTTSELSLRVLAPVTPGGAVAAHGRVIQVRRTLALAEVGVYDERERLIAQEVWDRMSGLEVLRAQLAGRLPMPPIHYLTGLTLTAASAGQATFTLPASEWLCAPARARIQGGAVALLGEAALSAAIQTRIPAGTALAPVDLKVNYLRPLIADGRATLGRGRVLHAGRRIAVASAEVLDADGRAVAIATGSAMILPNRPAALGAPPP